MHLLNLNYKLHYNFTYGVLPQETLIVLQLSPTYGNIINKYKKN